MHDLERLVIQSPVLFAEGGVGFPADADYSADFGEQLGFLTQKGIAIAPSIALAVHRLLS